MDWRLLLALLVLTGLGSGGGGDTADVNRYHKPLLPSASTSANAGDNSANGDVNSLPPFLISVGPQAKGKAEALQPQSRLEIVRYVSGEFAKVLLPIPSGKRGYRISVGQKLDEKDLKTELRKDGAAANIGDTVQVTGIEFRAKEIFVEINGGGKSKFHLRDHLSVGVGGTTAPGTGPDPAAAQRPVGGTIILDYGKNVPDMSADDLMTDLRPFLDFTREHSGAVNWVDTLPQQFKDAIQNREAVPGMNHDMVLAALGRPEHKVRERTPDGDETEDWIYGSPPARTTFVTFAGDKVIRVEQFN
jgi:hypothetical protein